MQRLLPSLPVVDTNLKLFIFVNIKLLFSFILYKVESMFLQLSSLVSDDLGQPPEGRRPAYVMLMTLIRHALITRPRKDAALRAPDKVLDRICCDTAVGVLL